MIDTVMRLGEEGYPGVIQIRIGERIKIREAFGTADRLNGLPHTMDTRFAVASVTKMFTAVRVYQLAEEGLIDLDRPIASVLDRLPQALPRESTVMDLLGHRSGYGDYIDDDAELPFEQMPVASLRCPEDYWPILMQVRPTPGGRGRASYSSAGFILLGLMIEHITGRSYFEEIRDSVFDPAAMPRSGFDELDALPRDCARGYLKTGEINTDHLPARGGPDGGAYCSAGDISRFFDALHAGKLLSSTSLERMIGGDRVAGEGEIPSRGLIYLSNSTGYWRGHSGGDPGASAVAFQEVDRNIEVICLANEAAWAFRAFRVIREDLASVGVRSE
jgi:CubicO group peptidase (beta-lactamase class C family)